MDPLGLLREFNAQGALGSVRAAGDEVLFGDKYSFPKSSTTRLKSLQTDEFYNLESVLLYIQNKHDLGQYVKLANQNKVKNIHIKDRKGLVSFVEGIEDAATIPQIATELPASLILPASAGKFATAHAILRSVCAPAVVGIAPL